MSDEKTKIELDYERWREDVLDPLEAKRPPRRGTFPLSDGTDIDPLFVPGWDEPGYAERLGFPGEYPYTRGVQPNMYRGRFWTMRQYAGFATAEESNQRYIYLLEQGQTGLSVAFDLPTQMGYDSDHAMSTGEVGKVGVAISCLDDMRTLFRDIPLDKVSTSMTINSTAAILLAMYIAVAEENGVSREQLRGTIQNDLLKEYVARGTYIFPPEPSLRIITDIFDFCSKEMPQWNTISISGYHIREAGSDAVQEVAFTLADGMTYVQAAIDTGLDVDKFASRLAFFFGVHNNLLEEVAKFRAARRLWARIMKERFGAKSKKSLLLRFHSQTAGCALTAQQPQNNVVRVALQALAAILGGTQSLHTNSMDEALALPSEDAVRLALRTQQVIAHESGVADFVDPLAGSYAVEAMTDEIELKAEAMINRIMDMGGMLRCIESGWVKRQIADTSYKYQRRVEDGDQVVVGQNRFQMEEGPQRDILRVDPTIAETRAAQLGALRGGRDASAVAAALETLTAAAKGDANLIPCIIDAVKAEATLGEISGTLEAVFGRFQERPEV
jgi:methylmalonyl-CoA mutase N-terminal domain/subunit